jgi:hypothetical protein
VFIFGGVVAIIALIGIVLDVFFGSVSGVIYPLCRRQPLKDLRNQINPLLGLYTDLLNIINQMVLFPAFCAFAAHRKTNIAFCPACPDHFFWWDGNFCHNKHQPCRCLT